MFPLRDENPTLRTSVVTFLIIGINIFVWVFIQGLGSERSLISSICNLGLISGELLGRVQEGTRIPISSSMVCVIGEARWHTLLTHMFLHGSWFHIIGNLWFLVVFGDNVEDSMGRWRFVLFYLLCGIAAAAAQMIVNPSSPIPMVGASGAISGVMGAYAVLYPRTPVHLLVIFGFFIDRVIVPAYFMLGYWFLIQLLSALPLLGGGQGEGIAFWAHVGGFVAGILLVFLFRNPELVDAHRRIAFRRWGRG